VPLAQPDLRRGQHAGTMDALQHGVDAADLHQWEAAPNSDRGTRRFSPSTFATASADPSTSSSVTLTTDMNHRH
jgi:hypothetical protein